MPPLPQTYEDWLALSPNERREIVLSGWSPCGWNAYSRDGIAIAFMAATRLALQSPCKIQDIQIGTFHGGEYLLHLTVSAADYEKCPPPFEQEFEGFRVVWFPARNFEIDPSSGASIDGRWSVEECRVEYEFEITHTTSGVVVSGHCRATHDRLLISDATVNREYVLFTAFHPRLERVTNHVFRLVGRDRCEDSVTRSEYYTRIS